MFSEVVATHRLVSVDQTNSRGYTIALHDLQIESCIDLASDARGLGRVAGEKQFHRLLLSSHGYGLPRV